MKKALIVSNSSGLITLFLENDVRILKENGFSIECACNTDYPDQNTDVFFEENNIAVHHIDFPIRNLNVKKLLVSYSQLKQLIKNEKYDIVHCHSTIAAALTRQCTKQNKKIKVLYTSHGFPFFKGNTGRKARIFYNIENYYSKNTNAILTICKEDYHNAKKMKCHNVFYMKGVGVDINRFINVTCDKYEYRKKIGIDINDIMILAIGEINTNKNHQVIIRALAKINNPSYILAICGREVTEIGKKDELQRLADSLNVRIRFLGFRKDIPEICKCADIGVISSLKEGLGLSGVEMLASGIPVVGSSRQGIRDYIVDGKTGFLADPNSSKSFAEGILRAYVLKNDNKTPSNCRKMAKSFNKMQAYNVIKKAYKTVLGE